MRIRVSTALVLSCLMPAVAWACPNLTGAYTCTDSQGQSETIQLSQTVSDQNITVYVYNGTSLQADNMAYAVPDDGTIRDATLRTWCDDDSTWKTELLGKYWRNGAYYGDLRLERDFRLDASTNLLSVTSGALTNSSGSHSLDSSMTCTRNQ
jgi:hypothetical protein